MRRWFSGRSWLLHVALVVGVGGCLGLGYWQYVRATGGNGLSWAYVVEWPIFAGVVVYVWWDLLHHPHIEAPKVPPEVLGPGWFRAQQKGELSTAPAALGRPRPSLAAHGGPPALADEAPGRASAGVAEDAVTGEAAPPGIEVLPPDPDALSPQEREEAERIAAYNRYLADLAVNGKRRTW